MILKVCLLVLVGCSFITCPPVMKKPEAKKKEAEIPGFGVEYERYLQEVFKELETDSEFKTRAQNLNKTEDIAKQLDFVHHSVRTKLDELKRREVDRLNAAEKLLEAKKAGKNIDASGAVLPSKGIFKMERDHLDAENPHTFEIHDLERLVQKVTKDLAKVDKQQESEYKRYEMEKEHLRKKKLKKIKDPKKRVEQEKKWDESKKRHNKHPKLHEPGSEDQLKEIWEKEDHLEKDSFDPNTFFHMHDYNGDGHLDTNEVEALMEQELGKVYDPENPDDDENEKYHEMMKMRQEAFKHIDKNQDDMISLDEFKAWSKRPDFKKDNGWKTTEEKDKKPFEDNEFQKFEEDYDKEHHDDDDEDDTHHETGDAHPASQQHPDPLKFEAHANAGKAAADAHPPAAAPAEAANSKHVV